MGFASFVLFAMTSSFLKYEFRQLNEEIEYCVKRRKLNLLMKAMNRHQINTELTNSVNLFFSINLGGIYFNCTPAVDILVYLSFQNELNIILRLLYISVALQMFSLFLAQNFTASSFTATAHKPIKHLYTFMANKKLSLKKKMKIYMFIQKLSGKPIGFYCFNLFAFNNYAFYQYISFVSVTYFLILDLMSFLLN